MKEEVERIKKLVGIDHNRWEQPCACDKCKNMCKVPCIGTPKDIEAIIDAGYADRLKETMWMVGYLAVKEKPIAMIQPTEKDGWCAFRQPDGLCELHDRGLKPTEEGDDFAKQKHDEFYAYVKHHCPGFEDKIEWEYFQAYKTMPWNLSQQVKFWSNYGIAFK